MAYSLRTRSASAVKPETETPAVKATVKKTPAAPKKAPAKKAAPVAKKAAATPKKATAAAPKKTEVKKEEPTVVDAKVESPTKTKARAAVKKAVAPKKSAATPKKAPAVKAKTAAKPKVAAKAKAPARKAAALKKVKVEEKRASMVAPVVTIEEIDEELQAPLLPEVEPISHAEEEEKVIEMVEGQVVNTHIRFSDAEESESEAEMEPSVKMMSVRSDDFEALDEMKDEPEHFELYNSEESETETEVEAEKADFESIEPTERSLSPAVNAHSAFEAFTSQEDSKTFNWNKPGSTYYIEPEAEVAKIDDMPLVVECVDEEIKRSPVVISNPFGFGFTATTEIKNIDANSTAALNILGDSAVNVSKPNPYIFNSHFQSVSSPLDKLCNLTSQSNPIAIARTFGNIDNSSSMMATSYLPTSPAAGMSKTSRSPSINGDEKEARSPSTIQSIIVDDKHEDFSAF